MMHLKEGELYMSVHISKNAELFYKALGDIWVAEQTWHGMLHGYALKRRRKQ